MHLQEQVSMKQGRVVGEHDTLEPNFIPIISSWAYLPYLL